MNFQEDQKGLFTFYRQQAEIEEKLREQKKKKKVKEPSQPKSTDLTVIAQKPKRKYLQPKTLIKPTLITRRQKEIIEQVQKRSKFSLGESVIIVNAEKRNKNHENKYFSHKRSKISINKIEDLSKFGGHYIESKELGLDLSPLSLSIGSQSIEKQKKVIVEYIRRPQQGSRNELPPIQNHNRYSSGVIVPKRYKSKKVELALKSESSEIIKKIREKLKDQMLNRGKGEASSKKTHFEQLLNHESLKQRNLIELLNNNIK